MPFWLEQVFNVLFALCVPSCSFAHIAHDSIWRFCCCFCEGFCCVQCHFTPTNVSNCMYGSMDRTRECKSSEWINFEAFLETLRFQSTRDLKRHWTSEKRNTVNVWLHASSASLANAKTLEYIGDGLSNYWARNHFRFIFIAQQQQQKEWILFHSLHRERCNESSTSVEWERSQKKTCSHFGNFAHTSIDQFWL